MSPSVSHRRYSPLTLLCILSFFSLDCDLLRFSMGGTYAGNAVSCAAGVAVQEAFRDEKILDNVAERSNEIFQTLRDLKNDPVYGDSIAEVRGLGLMVGIEFKSPSDPYTPSDGKTGKKVPEKMSSRVQAKCLEQGMLTLTTSVFETIR